MSKTKKSGPAIFMYCIIAITVITSIVCFSLYYTNIYIRVLSYPFKPMLEWISYTKVQRCIAPFEVVNPSLSLRIIRIMQLNTPVKTQNNECYIYAKAQACIHTQLLVEFVDMEYSIFGDLYFPISFIFSFRFLTWFGNVGLFVRML